MNEAWHWFTQTDAGLVFRIGTGAVIFISLALIDLIRRGREATRWREYLFLLAAVAVAMIYGITNDQITVRISPEYFLFGKGLEPIVGSHLERLPWEAAKVGMKATWTVGLIIGVALLLANNPRRDRARLPYPILLWQIPKLLAVSVGMAAVLGFAGAYGGLTFFSDDFRQMVLHDEFRPYRFMAVYGVHLGGYIGGFVGTVWGVIAVIRQRRAGALML